ncbi:MAG: hypothetical protein ACOX7C_04540 [Brevefilum sp.]
MNCKFPVYAGLLIRRSLVGTPARSEVPFCHCERSVAISGEVFAGEDTSENNGKCRSGMVQPI